MTSVLESVLPGITSYMLSKCPAGHADAINGEFPIDNLFTIVSEIKALDFAAAVTLLDLDVEIKRQATERKQLFESFQNPHPNLIFNIRKSSWFCSLVVDRVDGENYHATYVSSVRFNEVNAVFEIFIFQTFFSLLMMARSAIPSKLWRFWITLFWTLMIRFIRMWRWHLHDLLRLLFVPL